MTGTGRKRDALGHDGTPDGLRRYHHANWMHYLNGAANAADKDTADQWCDTARWHLERMLRMT